MNPTTATIVSVVIVSIVSLIGVIALAVSEERLKSPLDWLVGLAIGALFGDAVFHLLPESFAHLGKAAGVYLAAGLVLFFIFEKLLHWRHSHKATHPSNIEPIGWLNLSADGIHNFIDGMLIAASYLVSAPIGYATTVAVILHEIPQELGDYGILREANFSRRAALFWNFLSGLAAILGAMAVLYFGIGSEESSVKLLAFTAGGFLYMVLILLQKVGSELTTKRVFMYASAITLGVVAMWLLTFVG